MSTINTENGAFIADEPLTTTITSQAAPGLLRNAIDERIVKIRPMATPLDQISRCAGAKACNSLKVDFYAVDFKAIETATTRTVTGNSTQGDKDNPCVLLPVSDARIFSESDTVLIPDVRVGDQELTLYVAEVTAVNTLMAVPLNSAYDGSAFDFGEIPSGSKVIRMGRAAAELDVQSPQFMALPRKSSNNCQIFKMQIEQSTFQKLADKEVNWSFSDQEEAAIVDMRLGMEKNFLFGTNRVITNPRTQAEIYLTGGIWNQTDHDVYYDEDTVFDDAWFVQLTHDAFTGTAAGSARKILIAGTSLMAKLSKYTCAKTIDASKSLVRYGIEFHEIRTNFGSLYCVTSEIFDQCGHADDGIIIDPECLTKYVNIPFRADTLDLRTSGQRNSDAVVLTEASCLVLRHPRTHVRVIYMGQ